MKWLLLCLLSVLPCWASQEVDAVRVIKSQRKLQLLAVGKVQYEFVVALGGSPLGHKQQEGDRRTPEGVYLLDYKKEDSGFYRAIHISYPNPHDTAMAQGRGVNPGGQVMIHGQKNGLGWLSGWVQRFDWTQGCVALSNEDMDVVWRTVKAGTPIVLLP